MNRFQITADVDVTLYLGVLTKHKRQSSKIEYVKLDELFKSENVYLPTRDELKIQLMKLCGNIKHEFIAYLRELTDESLFKIDDVVVYLPLSDEAFIAPFGTVSMFVNGTFDALIETDATQEDVFDVVESALNMAINSANFDTENLDARGMACLDVKQVG